MEAVLSATCKGTSGDHRVLADCPGNNNGEIPVQSKLSELRRTYVIQRKDIGSLSETARCCAYSGTPVQRG
eukprot:scaffold257405_cov15-Prasinocladus_malaysianus.AAC.1